MSRSLITCELVGMDCDRFVLVFEKFRTLLDGFVMDLKTFWTSNVVLCICMDIYVVNL